MSNAAYPKGAEKILSGAINFAADIIKVALVSTGYTFSAGHEFLSALGATRIGVDQVLASKTIAGGVFDAADVDFGTVASGSEAKALVLYKDTGNAATSPLLLYWDGVPGLPMTTNGGAVKFPWDNGASKIAAIGLPFYPLAAQGLLAGSLKLLTATLKVVLLPASYVYSSDHQMLSDIEGALGDPQTLNSKTIAGGVLDAADVDFGNSVAAGAVGSVLIYVDSGLSTTSMLVLHIKDVTGLPLTANGAGIDIRWSDGPHKIVSLLAAS